MTQAQVIGSPPGSTVTTRDRLGFGLFLAFALHAAFILGIGLESIVPQPEPELTVSLYASVEPIAEAGQEQTIGNQVTDVTKEPPKAVAAEPPLVKNKPAPATSKKRFDRDQLVGAIASLQPTEVTTGSSRVRRLEEHSASKQTLAAEEAYLAMWRRKCERIGRINYPPGNIQGELVMRVSILSNGYLESVRIIRSSGSSLLDNAALQTVKQASPYQPFSLAMRKAYDRLEFTRTWQYSRFGTNINY